MKKILIIYKSIHQGNTKKIADIIAKETNAKIMQANEVKQKDIDKHDIIGLGSGIYAGHFHNSIKKLIEKINLNNKKVFVFATSGFRSVSINNFAKRITKLLEKNNAEIVGEFYCRGYDNWGPFKILGGIRKGRPNKIEQELAKKFAQTLKNK